MGEGAYRAVLFDLDGTMVETESLHLPTWTEALRPHGIEVDEVLYRDRISGRGNAKIVGDLLPDLSDEEGRAVAEAKEADFRERAVDLEPLPGLVEFLEEVRRRGLDTAVVSNAPRENAAAVLRALGLDGGFGLIVLADDVGMGKPDPAPYRAAVERLGIAPSRALAFEDSVSGIASAVGAGIPTVGIAFTNDAAALREAGAFEVVEDFTDPRLRGLLDR
ncbi:MAG TPA: HAD family phosphatase [Rubrobacteraceae bacterium]|nr:HAD family phosphatase [Rubrobacteraceae bacterium]